MDTHKLLHDIKSGKSFLPDWAIPGTVEQCSICSMPGQLFGSEEQQQTMLRHQICHVCRWWAAKAIAFEKPHMQRFLAVSNGHLFIVQPEILEDRYDAPRQETVVQFNDGHIVKTNSLVACGQIPWQFMPHFYHNAYFLKGPFANANRQFA